MIPRYRLFHSLDEIAYKEVQLVVTSPPYYKLRKYGGSSDELGQEKTPREFIDRLVSMLNAINLHPQGSICVNLGDKRVGSCLMIPEMFSMAMVESGWKLIDKIVWAKVECGDDGVTDGTFMTEPAKGRFNGSGYEPIYRFVKDPKNTWTDMEATNISRQGVEDTRYLPAELMHCDTSVTGRRTPNVWRCQYGQTRRKHYAVYPPAICERLIAAYCPMCMCSECGHLETRLTDMVEYDEQRGSKRVFGKYTGDAEKSGRQDTGGKYTAKMPVTTGWTSCECKKWRPGIVLDPFAGSGTTGEVAIKLGRDFIGIDLYDEYHNIMIERLDETQKFLTDSGLDPWLLRK